MNRLGIFNPIFVGAKICVCRNLLVVLRLDGQFNFSSLPPSPPPSISPPPLSFSTPSLCFLVSKCLNQLHFLTLHLQTSHSTYTSLLLNSWLYAFFSSLCSSLYFRDNSLTFSGLLSAHFFLRARHPLQVALSPLNISNALCPLHFQHCFFSTSSTTISPQATLCFRVFKCSFHPFFLILPSHTSQ